MVALRVYHTIVYIVRIRSCIYTFAKAILSNTNKVTGQLVERVTRTFLERKV